MSRYGSLLLSDRGWRWNLLSFSLAAAVLVAFSPCLAQEWEVEWVDYARDFGQLTSRCLAVDGLGNLHLAYGLDHLYYAHFDGSVWLIEVADSSCWSIRSASIALDPQGRPHVAYYDVLHGDLKYAMRTDSEWSHCTVDTSGNVGSHCCIALGPTGLPQIAYHDATHENLKHAYKTGTAWSTELVDSTGSVGTDLSFAISPTDFAHIVYYDQTLRDTKHAWKEGSVWERECVDQNGIIGKEGSLAVDGLNRLHVSYYENTSRSLRYALRDIAGWHTEVADAGPSVGQYSSIAVDANGEPHISYYDRAWCDLAYAQRGEDGWHLEYADAEDSDPTYGPFTGMYTSLALDPQGCPHIAYIRHGWAGSGAPPQLKHSLKDPSGWQQSVVDVERGILSGCSLALNVAGTPHIAYEVGTESRLRIASRDPAGAWVSTLTSLGLNAGYTTTSLAVAVQGDMHVCYATGSFSYQSLKYAAFDGSNWSTALDLGLLARLSGLRLDSEGSPHVVYSATREIGDQVFTYDIWHEFRDDQGWHEDVVLQGESWNVSSSFSLDSQGNVHAAYSPDGGDFLYHFYEDETGWHFDVIDSSIGSKYMISLALDHSDRPYVSYLDSRTQTLRCAYQTESGWHVDDLLSQVQYGASPIALHPDGTPHIVVGGTDSSGTPLRVIHGRRGASTWQWDEIPGLEPGYPLQLLIDRDGGLHVCCAGSRTKDIYYAYRLCPTPVGDDPLPGDRLRLCVEGPQPSRGVTNLVIRMPTPGQAQITMCDLMGRRVGEMGPSFFMTGTHRLIWDGLDDRGLLVPSGTYICSAEAGDARASTRVVLIR